MDATVEIVAEHGVHAVSVREASRRAGVSSGAPYRHFADKTSLLAAVAEEGFVALAERLQGAITSVGRADEILAALGAAYLDFAEAHPAWFRVMYAPEVSDRTRYPSLHAAWRRAFGVLRDAMLPSGAAMGLDPAHADLLALGPWTMVHGLATLSLDGQLHSLALASRRGSEIFERLVALQRAYRPASEARDKQ